MNLYRSALKTYITHLTRENLVVRAYAMDSTTLDDNSWRGVPITEIYGSQSPLGAPEFPLVTPSFNHAVLYHVPANGSLLDDRPPKPQIGHDKWDNDYVRMPCSTHSMYPVENSNGEMYLKKRWEIIQGALWGPIRSSQDLAAAILSYNTKFKAIWKFRALHKLFNEYLEEDESRYFFDVTLPEIAKLALSLPKLIQSPIPLLKQQQNRSVSLSQQQIACLLANAFFCTYPRRNTTKRLSEYASYPHINFNTLYECDGSEAVLEKLKCICHYFRRVCTKAPVGAVTFSRRAVTGRRWPCAAHAVSTRSRAAVSQEADPVCVIGNAHGHTRPNLDFTNKAVGSRGWSWAQSSRPLAAVPLHVDPAGTIEDAHGLVQLDFANKYLGGGVLGNGCVQEEIRFVICPELMISMLFTEVLRSNEALMMIGCERYSQYAGYGSTFQFVGDYRDCAPRDSSARRRCAVLAVDALPYHNVLHEYRREAVTRELNKAWVGMTFYTEDSEDSGESGDSESVQYPGIATGNWGCGAFGGSARLKALLQLMAAAQARRPLAYYTFHDTALRDDLVNMYDMLARHNVTVGQLYKYILRFCRTDVRKADLHAFIHQVLRDEQAKSPKSKDHKKDSPEPMETSAPSEAGPVELTDSLEREFSKSSPDIFSEDEEIHSLSSIQLQRELETCAPNNKITLEHTTDDSDMALNYPKASTSDQRMSTSDQRMSSSDHKMSTNNSQISSDCKSTPKELHTPIVISDDASSSSEPNMTKQENKMTPKNHKNTLDNHKMVSSHTSRLFDEMQKFDADNGRLNFSEPHHLLLDDSKNTSASESDVSMETSHGQEPLKEARKKIARKITDYFSKKSI